MGSHPARTVSEPGRLERTARHIATVVFGLLIVGAIGYEAIEAAQTFSWIAYPLVLGAGVGAFLLSRVAWKVTIDWADAQVQREHVEHED